MGMLLLIGFFIFLMFKISEDSAKSKAKEEAQKEKRYEEIRAEIKQKEEKREKEYMELVEEYNVPKDAYTVQREKENWLLWRADDVLTLFPSKSIENGIPQKIMVADIDYFEREGDVHYATTSVSYGYTKPNLKGAVIGGAIAGTAGAIIGSQKSSTEPVNYTKAKKIDERRVALYLLNQPAMYFSFDDYRTIEILIPEKERNIVMAQREELAAQSVAKENVSIPEQIEKLSELKESGILTEEEFSKKKTELLARL